MNNDNDDNTRGILPKNWAFVNLRKTCSNQDILNALLCSPHFYDSKTIFFFFWSSIGEVMDFSKFICFPDISGKQYWHLPRLNFLCKILPTWYVFFTVTLGILTAITAPFPCRRCHRRWSFAVTAEWLIIIIINNNEHGKLPSSSLPHQTWV